MTESELTEQLDLVVPNNLHYNVARLHLELGDITGAENHCLQAYNWAIADSEPYSRRAELLRARELAAELSLSLPITKEYVPTKAPPARIEVMLSEGIKTLSERSLNG